jgi:hypothetical protein
MSNADFSSRFLAAIVVTMPSSSNLYAATVSSISRI